MAWRLGAIVGILLVLSAGLTGCLGSESSSFNETTECTEEESNIEQSQQLTPGDTMGGEMDVSGAPAQFRIQVTTQGRGTLDAVLEQEGTTVWEESWSNTGNGDFSGGAEVQEPGTYTLTVSTQDGLYNEVSVDATLSYSKGC